MLDRVDGVAAISSDRRASTSRQHGTRTPIATMPFGVDPDGIRRHRRRSGTPVFFHLGSMDWLPNEEGVRWLLAQVWPRVMQDSIRKRGCTWPATRCPRTC